MAAVKPAKAVLAGAVRLAPGLAAAKPICGARRAAGRVRCAVAEAAKEESFTYQAEARALAAAGSLASRERRGAATDDADAAADAEHARPRVWRR